MIDDYTKKPAATITNIPINEKCWFTGAVGIEASIAWRNYMQSKVGLH